MAATGPALQGATLRGPRAWLSTLLAMCRKELTIMLRYPVELVASFGQILLIVMVLTLAGLMFSPTGLNTAADQSGQTAGVVAYGFVLFMFLSDTLWSIGYNVRREQKQGTLEQLYLSPASKFASLLSRVTVTLVWTGAMTVAAAGLLSLMLGRLPAENLPLGVGVLALALSGTFGTGFAFAALTLRIREAGQTLANLFQFAFMILCAPFFPFAALPDWLLPVSRLIPLAHGVDAFRSALMGFPAGYPELAPLALELAVVAAFGLVMPWLGYWLYRREENRARAKGSLSEY
ncbi:MAG: ABC transporter permease [Anaerolineales bacterium]|nr:ABC transporter permease [Anaerolineales bacterium]